MAVEYTWSISALECYPEHEGQPNVVFTAHWRLHGADGEHAGGVYGSQGLTLDPEAEFVAFEDLTEETVIGWVKDAMGAEAVEAHEANVAAQIDALVNPPVIRPALPWGE
jgi:hypothetical protein